MKQISENTINRMPQYLRVLEEKIAIGVERVSSSEIAYSLGTSPSQVRQDFSAFGTFGAQGYGYNTDVLLRGIKNILGVDRRHSVIVVGIGCMGTALIEHLDYEKYGYHIDAAFDVRPEVVGETVRDVKVHHISELDLYIEKHPADICILTVSNESAKGVAATLSRLGVSSIWNFTNERLNLNNCVVRNVNLLDNLFALTYYLEQDRHALAI